MKARNSLIPLALFAVAFVSSLFAMKMAKPVAAQSAKPISSAQWVGVARAAAPTPQPEPQHEPVAEVRTAPAAPPPGPTPAAAAAMAAPVVEESPPWPAEALQSFAAVEGAVDRLGHSSDLNERIVAIAQLAETARNGVEVAQVRASLRLAASDEVPEIAARAQEAYEKLVEREDR